MLNDLVWQRFKERARKTYSVCEPCQKDPSYKVILQRYQEHHNEVAIAAARVKPRAHPRQWPYSGSKAKDWPQEVALLEFLGDGTVVLAGETVDSSWRGVVRERRNGAATLGLHMRPTEDVRQLRAILGDLKRAGYKRVALQVRRPKLPYKTETYFLELDRKPIKVSVRPEDSIQVLVQALDIGV
jgi:hypothetical protein